MAMYKVHPSMTPAITPSGEMNPEGDTKAATATTVVETNQSLVEGLVALLERCATDGVLLENARKAIAESQPASSAIQELVGKAHRNDEVNLPEGLKDFVLLKEMPSVKATLDDPAFATAQERVQSEPHDDAAFTALVETTKAVTKAYQNAIELRVQEDKMAMHCSGAAAAGNSDFYSVYDGVWRLIRKSERSAVQKYAQAMHELSALTISSHAIQQTSKDPCELFQHAAKIKSAYKAFVMRLVDGMTSVDVSIPKGLKKMGRIVEKSLLKRGDDPGNAGRVFDLVRGMVLCDNMTHVAELVTRLCRAGAIATEEESTQDRKIVLRRVKDRFLKSPSAGGWRDCMVNFHLKDDPYKHICEIQLVHKTMMTARAGLPGHAVYNRVRTASELFGCRYGSLAVAVSKGQLIAWLLEWVKHRDESIRGHPNTWDVSRVTDMSELFKRRELKEFNDEIAAWDVSSVSNMAEMFNGASAFNQDIGSWDVANVTNMDGMFASATSFNGDISSWDVGKVTNMSGMFKSASSFSKNLGSWNVTNVTNMSKMFKEASSFNGDIGSWNVANVTNMSEMFDSAKKFNCNICMWDVSNVKKMFCMFSRASQFNGDLSRWNVSNVENMIEMFESASSFNSDLSSWQISDDNSTDDMFNFASSMESCHKPSGV